MKLKILSGIICLMLFVTGCGQQTAGQDEDASQGSNGDQVVFDLSLSASDGSFGHFGAMKFKEELERLSNGQLSVKTYYSNTFGGEREVIEMMGINSLDMAATSTGPHGTWSNEFDMFSLPFLFENYEHAYAVLDGEIGIDLANIFEEDANVKILAYWSNGFRQMTNSKRPVNNVSDISGLKHRVQESEVQIDTWRAYGADPTPISFAELFTALQQGVIDGQSNSLQTVYLGKYHEVQNHVSILNEVYSPYPLMMSKQLFDSLSSKQQEMIMEAAELSVKAARDAFMEQEENAYNSLKEAGITIIDEPDRDSFREKVDPVYEKWTPQIGEELIEEVRNYHY